MTNRAEKFEQALLSFDRISAQNMLINEDIETPPFQLIEQVVVPALEKIGQGWHNGTISLSQVYMSGKICEELVDKVLPPASPQRINQPTVAIVTLEDYHLLGKMIIYSALRASGVELQDWGRLDLGELVLQVKASKIQILLISTLMLPSALRIKEITQQLRQEGVPVKIVVGGAPFRFDDALWQEVGADEVGKNSHDALKITHELIKELS